MPHNLAYCVFSEIANYADYFLGLHDLNLPQHLERQTGLTSLCHYPENKGLGVVAHLQDRKATLTEYYHKLFSWWGVIRTSGAKQACRLLLSNTR